MEADGYVDDGEQGIWIATSAWLRPLITDIMIPRMNAFALVAQLRRTGCEIPVLLRTAKSGEWDQALDSGADDLGVLFGTPQLDPPGSRNC